MQGEYCYAPSDSQDNKVFIQRKPSLEQRDVQEHYGQKLAGFGEDEGDVVDVGEGGITKGRGKRGGDGDCEERTEDCEGGKDGGAFGA